MIADEAHLFIVEGGVELDVGRGEVDLLDEITSFLGTVFTLAAASAHRHLPKRVEFFQCFKYSWRRH